jgi:hypothetical protein
MGDPPFSEAQTDRVDRFNSLLRYAVGGRAEVEIVGMQEWMRSLPGGELNLALRPDGVHFSQQSTLLVADWLMPLMMREVGRQEAS